MEKTMAASAAAMEGAVAADQGVAAAMAAVVAPVADVKGKAVDASGSADLEAKGGARFVEGAPKIRGDAAVDNVVGGGSDGAAKRGLTPYDEGYYPKVCQYETDDEVEEDNFASYVQRQFTKFENGELKVMNKGKYDCHFCPFKIKAGDRASLEMHAMDSRHSSKEMKDKADHQALAKYLLGDRLPRYGRPASKKARRFF